MFGIPGAVFEIVGAVIGGILGAWLGWPKKESAARAPEENPMSTREEALATLTYQGADAVAEGVVNEGEESIFMFLLDHGWSKEDIEEGIRREMAR
jgi:hypothetical protein